MFAFILPRSFSFSPSPKRIFEVFVEYVNTSSKEKPLGKLKLLTWLLLLLDIIDPKILQNFPKDYEWDEVRQLQEYFIVFT